MIEEFERVRDLRPTVAPPAPEVRREALHRLQAAIANERPPVAARPTVEDDVDGLGPAGSGVRSPGARTTPAPRARLGHRAGVGAGWVGVAAALIAAVVVAGGAILVLGHGRQRAGGSAAGAGGAAVRGEIVDRTGTVLARSRVTNEVMVRAAGLPAPGSGRTAVFDRLAHLLGLSTRPRRCRMASGDVAQLAPVACAVARALRSQPTSKVVIAPSVSAAVKQRVQAHTQTLPGVVVSSHVVRTYPMADLAGQVLGTTGAAAGAPGSSTPPRSAIGKTGLEGSYDRVLRAGDTVKLELDAGLQRAGQSALAHSISLNGGSGGAFVAMNPQTGAVYAMGSLPGVDPNMLRGPLSHSAYRQLAGVRSGEPLIDRAIQSAGPVGTTFVPITATAALQSGAWSLDETYDDTGMFCIDGQCRHNSGQAAYGVVNLPSAIKVADDSFFYNLGARTNTTTPSEHPGGGPLDQWARLFGVGQATGIDLPGEVSGTLPTPAWRQQRNRLEAECDHATGPFTGKPTHPPGGCGIADGTNRPWQVGDNINLAVGQGDVQLTPLQLAVIYAAIANQGTIVRPHLGAAVENHNGYVLRTIAPAPVRHLNINPLYLQTIGAGLRAAASQPGGTSAPVFSRFAQTVYGKTGAAQYITHGAERTSAWFAGFVPASATNKPIVVVVTVENGGFGAVAAAPVARQILSQWFYKKPGPYQPGTSHTL